MAVNNGAGVEAGQKWTRSWSLGPLSGAIGPPGHLQAAAVYTVGMDSSSTRSKSVTNYFEETYAPESVLEVHRTHAELPLEALVKEDLLRLGIAFENAALQRAQGAKPKSYFIFSFDRVELDAMEQSEGARVPEEIALSGGAWSFRRTIVSVRINPRSPYRVVAGAGDGDGLELRLAGEPLARVAFPDRPAYYDHTLAGGRPLTEVAPTIEWGYLIYLTVYRRCQYFGRDEECRFCDINENYRQQRAAGRPYVTVKNVDDVLEALRVIAETDDVARAYTLTGGAVTDQLRGTREAEFYGRYVRAIEQEFPRRWISKMVTQALPLDDVRAYHDAGVQIYHPNYEVWDQALFEALCPGKARTIGYQTWMRRIEEAATVFGASHVIPNFVAGVELAQPHGFAGVQEALASTGEGLDHFMSQGIVPRFTTWCVEPLSELGATNAGPAPLEYHAGLLQLWRDTHARYRLPVPPGYGDPGVGRAVFSVSAFMDVVDPSTPVAEV